MQIGSKIFKLFIFLILNNIFSFFCHSDRECSLEKILICGVIKNGQKGFANVKKSAEALGSCFEDYRVIVYENNSRDTTKKLYRKWQKENKKVIFISEDLSEDFINNYCIKKKNYRTEFIARARNIVLDKAFSEEFDDFSYLIMADLDCFKPWDIDEIKRTIEDPQFDWDAVCGNGSYDTFSLLSNEFRLNKWLADDLRSPKLGGKRKENLRKILSKGIWYQVESFFGGIAIYKKNSIKGCRYRGLITSEYVDHLLKSPIKKDLIFKTFSKTEKIKVLLNLKKFNDWICSNYDPKFESNKFSYKSYYLCEHVPFHLDMIKNGYDKIYINPNFKSVSLQHRN